MRDVYKRQAFNEALLAKLQSYNVDLVVLAGCLVVIPQSIVDAYPNKIPERSTPWGPDGPRVRRGGGSRRRQPGSRSRKGPRRGGEILGDV